MMCTSPAQVLYRLHYSDDTDGWETRDDVEPALLKAWQSARRLSRITEFSTPVRLLCGSCLRM